MRRRSPEKWPARGICVLLALATVVGMIAPAWGAIYSDILGDPAQRAIERLTAKGIFRAGGDGTFIPTGPVSRIEFAVFLTRALGVSGQGALPEFKDGAEISKDAVPAVVALLRMATVSPQRAEIKKGAIVYQLTTDRGVYTAEDEVVVKFTVENTSAQDAKFEFTNTQFYDFIIRDMDRNHEVARWSVGRAFRPMTDPLTLAAGRKFEFSTQWKQLDQNDVPVPSGRYELTAVQTTKANPTSLSLVFNKGLMQGYPDNTFRARQPVTRAEAAALVVRAMSLEQVAANAPLAVPDAAEVPADLRSAVAVAIEKKIMLPTPQRTFQPGRPVTRAEVAWALDVLMDAGKRYDFSKGVLKDLHVGTPTLIAIEDEKKALRTYRVARAYAVYRNERLVDLKDLKPGDTLLLLKLGDVGDVAYIEATGK